MKNNIIPYQYIVTCLVIFLLLSCSGKKEKSADIVIDPKAMDSYVASKINNSLTAALAQAGQIDDSTQLRLPLVVKAYYLKNNYQPVWSSTGKWLGLADSLYNFIATAESEGLFSQDYHFKALKFLKDSLDADSVTRMNAAWWSRADLLLTDGFMSLIKDLKQGRLQPDSLSLNKDRVLVEKFFVATLAELTEQKKFTALLHSLQPGHKPYWELKRAIKKFVDNMDRKEYTYVSFPFKRGDSRDSLIFIKQLQQRLFESNCIDSSSTLPDSAKLFRAVKKYQLRYGLEPDGKYGKNVVNSLNTTDVEKFNRIVVTLDKYKQLPEEMPERYVWVNIPGYYLWVVESDTLVFESKVIVGKPGTSTPMLTSEISDLVIYPTWTVPNSIIVGEYLPRLKKNPNYISKIGLQIIDSKGGVVDPLTVNWSKYSRGIPYKVMQGSGDNNSLGVIKFNFSNPYYVYLHDTNQRHLFKNSSRALSHGCVRVQQWEKLAYFIAATDSIKSKQKDSLKYTADSIKTWIAKKERRRIAVKNHIPLYIRYFTCEGRNGVILFYDDIYGNDRKLIEKYIVKK